MGQAIAVRTDYTAGEVRRLATRAKDAAQARRLLAIAAVLEGASREDAAEIAGMDRQTLRDWVIRIQRAGAGWSHQHSLPGRAAQARRYARLLDNLAAEKARIGKIHALARILQSQRNDEPSFRWQSQQLFAPARLSIGASGSTGSGVNARALFATLASAVRAQPLVDDRMRSSARVTTDPGARVQPSLERARRPPRRRLGDASGGPRCVAGA